MNPLIRVYDLHKKEFGLEENKFLLLFEALLSTPGCSILECSAQISPKSTHGARLRLGYEQQNIQKGLCLLDDFLDKISRCENVLLNRDIFSQIVNNNLDVSRIIALGIGLDYKTNNSDSKVKYYLMVKGYPEKIEQVLSLHPPFDGIRDYLIHEEFTFGIDMYFDGRTGIEIYPFLDRQDFNNTELIGKFKLRDAVLGLIKECNLLHISFDGDGRRVLHFFNPQSPARFVRLLGNRRLSLAYSSVQILNYLLSRSYEKVPVSVNLCLIEDEIIAKDIQNIGLQYALTFRT
jgi:LynF/TruF/PatF family peptide O-prenyltransferase